MIVITYTICILYRNQSRRTMRLLIKSVLIFSEICSIASNLLASILLAMSIAHPDTEIAIGMRVVNIVIVLYSTISFTAIVLLIEIMLEKNFKLTWRLPWITWQLFIFLPLQHHIHRTIKRRTHLHPSPKLTRLDGESFISQFIDQVVIDVLRCIKPCCMGKIYRASFFVSSI